jgi:starvation-inducible DNA-binding protein
VIIDARWRTGNEDAPKMVQTLIEDFATVCEEFQEGIELAESSSDQPTADLLIGYKADLEKHMWMLRSYLG